MTIEEKILEAVEKEILEAQSCISDPPKNESNTCDWVILPLLYAAGYERRDIESRIADSTQQYPDYTILPSTPSATLYLEAKAWSVSLDDLPAKQALNYANHNGKRFVVLTNGQVWRLYDNSIQGLLADKLVIQASIQDHEAVTKFLTTLSKPQVLSGSLEQWANEVSERKKREAFQQQERQQRAEEEQRVHNRQQELRNQLHTLLPSQLKDQNDELVLYIALYLQEREDFKDITTETVSSWFDEMLGKIPLEKKEEVIISTQDITPHLQRFGARTLPLSELQKTTINGKKSKPIRIRTPDGTLIDVKTWVDIAEGVVSWLLLQPLDLPLPFEAKRSTRWFLNNEKVHRRSDLRPDFKKITVNSKTVYMDGDCSADLFISEIYALCLRMRIAPDEFHVTIEG